MGDIAEFASGGTPSRSKTEYFGGETPWITGADIAASGAITPRTFLTEAGVAASATRVVRAGTILLVTRTSVGKVTRADRALAFSQDITALQPDETRVDPDYLVHFLRQIAPHLRSFARGATILGVKREDVVGLNVPLPPLPEQRRIASILDGASEARSKTSAALERASEMADVAFLDMFGPPEANPFGLPMERLAELGQIVTGNTPSRVDPDNFGEDVEWIKSDNITATDPFVTQAREGLSVKGRRIGRTVDEGSVLVTCIAGSPRSIGNAALTNRTIAFNQQINAFVPKRLEPLFALHQFRCGKTLVQRQSTGGMKGIVSKSKLEDVRFMVPPPERQKEFSEIAARSHELAALLERRLKMIDELLSSLQARAFEQVI